MSVKRGNVSTKIEGGALTSALGKILSGLLEKMFRDPERDTKGKIKETEVESQDKTTGAVVYKVTTGSGYIFKMQMTPVKPEIGGERDADFDKTVAKWEDNPIYRLVFKGVDIEGRDKEETFDAVKQDKVLDTITEIAEKWYAGEGVETAVDKKGNDLFTSSKLRVRLKRVVGSESDDIVLQSVMASYDPTAALADLNTVLDNPEFAQSIPEEGAVYDIVPAQDGETMDVDQCTEECEMNVSPDAATRILQMVVCLKNDMRYIENNAKGKEMFVVKDMACNLRWAFHDIADRLQSYLLAHFQYVPNITALLQGCTPLAEAPTTVDSYIAFMEPRFKEIEDAIYLCLCNFDPSFQTELDRFRESLEFNRCAVMDRILMQ